MYEFPRIWNGKKFTIVCGVDQSDHSIYLDDVRHEPGVEIPDYVIDVAMEYIQDWFDAGPEAFEELMQEREIVALPSTAAQKRAEENFEVCEITIRVLVRKDHKFRPDKWDWETLLDLDTAEEVLSGVNTANLGSDLTDGDVETLKIAGLI